MPIQWASETIRRNPAWHTINRARSAKTVAICRRVREYVTQSVMCLNFRERLQSGLTMKLTDEANYRC